MAYALNGSAFTYFYPRPPRGGRLTSALPSPQKSGISIHALREEGDSTSISVAFAFLRFLSTPSARRATVQHGQDFAYVVISIHALREEGDVQYSGSR